ncbi:MAG: hypothetical protein NTAFB01_44330 [Nitrospira sp.]
MLGCYLPIPYDLESSTAVTANERFAEFSLGTEAGVFLLESRRRGSERTIVRKTMMFQKKLDVLINTLSVKFPTRIIMKLATANIPHSYAN